MPEPDLAAPLGFPEGPDAPPCPKCDRHKLYGLPLGMLGWLCSNCGERVGGGGQGGSVPKGGK